MIRIRVSTKASEHGTADMSHHDWSDTVKHIMDGISVMTAVGTIIKMIPAVAGIFTIVWTGIRIYESDTVQKLLGRVTDGE